MQYRFDRLEFAGSLGDLGILLPMAVGMIMVNGLDPMGLFLSVGLFYIISGTYFGVTTPVQPMKVVGSYAIAMALPASDIYAAGLTVGILLTIIGATGLMSTIARFVHRPVVRGIQLSTGTLLMTQGIHFVLGNSSLQTSHEQAEPFLAISTLGPLPLTWIFGAAAFCLTVWLLNSRRFPAGLAVIGFGILAGILCGASMDGLALGLHMPHFLPGGFPGWASFATALIVLAMPQLPMTLGNAVIANTDLAHEYFGDDAYKTTNKALCISMGLANIGGFLLGGMPMCHGAGGLAAHVRFGARTAGSNIMIGAIFVIAALILGEGVLDAARLIPLSVLGVLLLFAGSQLSLTILDVKNRKDLFITTLILGVTLASNLAVGFILGSIMWYVLQNKSFSV
ncbi:putative sulfate/molybdate transporter [Desulfovibrio inopinatus]|uniref:putative sulfate/molybdate transporter n=1 Tax=Desulfovibrio inopinatus TaxID=102109 RepID=UPI000406C7C1|nr:putative sulfate/molybdate transporter [Desulfovibrio inopinatus]